jgi:hypothetical protein
LAEGEAVTDAEAVSTIGAIGLVLAAVVTVFGSKLVKKADAIGVNVDGNLKTLNAELKEATAAILASAKQASKAEGELLRTDQQRDMRLDEQHRQEDRQDRKDSK